MENQQVKKEKCATIYLTQTTSTVGQFSGTGIGLGLSGSGLGIGGGVIHGDSVSQNQSKLAELFYPIQNEKIIDELSLADYLPGLLMIASSFLIKDMLRPGSESATGAISKMIVKMQNIPQLSDISFLILSLMGGFLLVPKILKNMNKKPRYKYSNEEFSLITKKYNEVDYEYYSNTITLGDKCELATRTNFVKMIVN
jgi:hypothetical protein